MFDVTGLNNHRYFIYYLFTLSFSSLIYVLIVLEFWSAHCSSYSGINVLSCDGWITFTAMNAVLHTFWVTALLTCQLYQVHTNIVQTIETSIDVPRNLFAGSQSWNDDQ